MSSLVDRLVTHRMHGTALLPEIALQKKMQKCSSSPQSPFFDNYITIRQNYEMVVQECAVPQMGQNYPCLHYLPCPIGLDTGTIPVQKQQRCMDLRYLNQQRNQRNHGSKPVETVSLVNILNIDSFRLDAPTRPSVVVLNKKHQ